MKIKVIQIGNSRGIRLPKKVIEKYRFHDELIMEVCEEGVMLKPKEEEAKLSWDDTFAEMASEKKDWSDMDILVDEGLDEL